MSKRLLDIVVTHYQEGWDIYRPFLDMIAAQRSVDFNKFKIWFVQDGPYLGLFPSGYLDSVPFDMEVVTIPHKGVSAARNAGMDKADSEWICFCDCDDSFSSIYSLKWIFYTLENLSDAYDMVWNKFYMNLLDEGDNVKINEEYNHVWIHNKYYRLSFLREHDIRFCERLYMSEDSAFNNVVELETDPRRIGTINTDEPLYAWVRRRGSITTDKDRYYKNIEGHFERNLYVLYEYRKRRHKRSAFVCARTITDAWAFLTRYPENEESIRITKRVAKFYQENKYIWRSLKKEAKKLAAEASEKEAGTLGADIPGRPTVQEWINRRLKVIK